MGFFRFRRSIKLLPGVRLNFGKKSASISVGTRGASYTIGTRGSRTTVGIPGTGLSYTSVNSDRRRSQPENTGEKQRSGCLTYGVLGFLVIMAIGALSQGSKNQSQTRKRQSAEAHGAISSPIEKGEHRTSSHVPSFSPSIAPSPQSANPNPTPVAVPQYNNQAKIKALARYPELGKANSSLNTEFVRRYHLYRENRPSYFQNPEWPMQLAEESAKALNFKE
jgi:hypothetical protein